MLRDIKRAITLPVIVSALGYFVDIFDLVLFGMLRIDSLRELGLSEEEILIQGENILSLQMLGFLLGGILWGILGDKLGRKQILFGSIALYSIANIANAFVTDIATYNVVRFFAGLGLAGELGAAVTLVSELLDKEIRGYGTMIVASVGLLGAVAAGLLANTFHWRVMYFIGGVLGLLLLVARAKVLESSMFEKAKAMSVKRGDFLSLFTSWNRFSRYIRVILVGVPIWYAVAILVMFSPEMARHLNVQGEVNVKWAIMWTYLGVAVGDVLSGTLSQLLRSRKKAVIVFLMFLSLTVASYLLSKGLPVNLLYILMFLLGVGTGYWAVFITIAAELFGTNLRATVATTSPNFVRGSVALITPAFQFLREDFGMINAAAIIGFIVITLAFISILTLEETYGKDLDFVEQ
ncbi:MAG: MFS transporter [Chlorobi bacterium]|nr:MFS transporter [Chlorobiota bacterium]